MGNKIGKKLWKRLKKLKEGPKKLKERLKKLKEKLKKLKEKLKKLKEGLKKLWDNILGIIGFLLVILGIGVAGFVLKNFFDFRDILDLLKKITLPQIVTFVGALIGIMQFFKRLSNQEQQIKLQINQRVDDRFTTSVELLGNTETSTRTGAIYSLYQLAVEEEKYRSQIAQILCSYVRSKTTEEESLQKSKDPLSNKISNEIQTTINLLVREVHNIKGLYCQDFRKKLPRLDFTHAYLVGADFSGAQCQGANFRNAQCQGAKFIEARCQDADFGKVQCQEADFNFVWCHGTSFIEAQCQGVSFIEAQCQGANFGKARCQGAYFGKAQCQGVSFIEARCQSTSFIDTQCQGAYAAGQYQSLSDRIDKPTELGNIIIAGEFSGDDIQSIDTAEKYCSKDWYKKMQEIIEGNKDEREKRGIPENIIDRVLGNSKELRAIINKNWKKLETISAKKKRKAAKIHQRNLQKRS